MGLDGSTEATTAFEREKWEAEQRRLDKDLALRERELACWRRPRSEPRIGVLPILN